MGLVGGAEGVPWVGLVEPVSEVGRVLWVGLVECCGWGAVGGAGRVL